MTAKKNQEPLIIIASNRGPYSFTKKEDGSYQAERGAGGLVTALSGLAERHDVMWIAAAMNKGDRQWAKDHEKGAEDVEGIQLRLILPNNKAYDLYYNTIANPLLWFIQHQLWDIPREPSITDETWRAWEDGYLELNKMFANAIADEVNKTKRPVIVLPQDYHLYMVPYYLREGIKDHSHVQIQPFIHIPWPGPDAWRILPPKIRTPLLNSLLQSDRIGFQTQKDAFNFVQTCRFYLPEAHSRGARDSIEVEGRKVSARPYPISIDVEKIEEMTEEPQLHLLKSQFFNFVGDRKLILRVDRTEPSKNILRGLKAYRVLLEKYPEHRGTTQMFALLVPSRLEVEEYQDYLANIMAEAGMINAHYSDSFWEPVRIIVGDNYPRAIAAMQLYDVLLVNPLADGMNLVAKEGSLVNQRDGVLILSEFAGAFYELGEHTTAISPFDIHGTMEAMHQALTMPLEERKERADALRDIVRKNSVRQWFFDQVDDALEAFEKG